MNDGKVMSMAGVRRFLIASSLARIIRNERGIEARIVEGHFPGQFGRTHFVSMEPGHAFLVLTDADVEGGAAEERAEVPSAHAEALLDVATGRIGYERSRLPLGREVEAILLRFVQPAGIDVLTVTFGDEQLREAFSPPPWFGPEVTGEPTFQRHSIALSGPPEMPDVPLTNAALEALLQAIEDPSSTAVLVANWLTREVDAPATAGAGAREPDGRAASAAQQFNLEPALSP